MNKRKKMRVARICTCIMAIAAGILIVVLLPELLVISLLSLALICVCAILIKR